MEDFHPMRKNRITIALASLLALAGIVGLTMSSAQAGPGDGPYRGGSYFADGTLWQEDVAPALDQVYKTTYNNTVGFPALRPEVAAKLELGTTLTAQLAESIAIVDMGGAIATRATEIPTYLSLPAGKWLLQMSGQFQRRTAAAYDVAIRPQVSFWVNKNADSVYDWQNGESVPGAASPNVEIAPVLGRHQSFSGTGVLTVTGGVAQSLQVAAFGYADDASTKGSGEVDVTTLTLTATRIG